MFVGANLAHHVKYWEQISDNTTVINWIEHGIKIPFQTLPEQF